jgi:hypothetical protein
MATVQFNLPEQIEQKLRGSFADLDAAAKEAALVEMYRQDQLTQFELGAALGVSRLEVDGVLKRHNVTEDLMSVEEFNRQQALLENLLGE